MVNDFFTTANDLISKNLPFATALVVRAEKPTSGKAGDKAIVTADGTVHGWIGGSCAQPTVSREAVKSLEDGQSRFIRLSPDPTQLTPREGLIDYPMTCFSGGTLEIYIEPQFPQPRLLVVGNLPVTQALVKLGKAMNYSVVAVEIEGDTGYLSAADHIATSLDDIEKYVRPQTYAVVATHGNYDEAALDKLLQTNPRYIGLVVSHKRFGQVKEYLQMQGYDDEALSRIKAPAGLDIQAKSGDEIAVSIIAEIVQRRNNDTDSLDWSEMVAAEAEPDNAPAVATDPVCGMSVEIATAEHIYEYEGETYYFCGPGCKETFAANPQSYLQPAVAIDPVCGMEVDMATAQYTSEYNGETYYFCCGGCKLTFDKNPQEYLTPAVAIDPVCGMEVDTATAQYTSEYNGETFYFCAAGCKMSFDKDPASYLEHA